MPVCTFPIFHPITRALNCNVGTCLVVFYVDVVLVGSLCVAVSTDAKVRATIRSAVGRRAPGSPPASTSDMTVKVLKADLKRRGLASAGLKHQLVLRLQEALDAESSESVSDADESHSDGFDINMDDEGCGEDTDYEGYTCTNSECPCTSALPPTERHVSVKLWLAADYKFLLVVLGFKGATSKHPCIFCKANLSDPREWKKPRPLDERKATDLPDKEFSQHCTNLFKFIPRDRCRIDVLHMLLRCMDRFIHCAALVWLRCWAPHLDKDEDKLKALNAGLGKAFAKAAGQGSITFAEKSGSTKTWKLTRVGGSGYKRILENFCFADSLPANHGDTAKLHQDTWNSFNDIYTHVNTKEPWGHERLRDTLRLWFSTCVGGYCADAEVMERNKPLYLASYLLTPYFHCLLCHVPQMIKFKEIYSFTGQNFEKSNHVHQRIHAAASNHHSDNRPVLMQNLRVLMNKMDARITPTPCDSPACSVAFKFPGHWIAHRTKEHPAEVSDESDVQAVAAFNRCRERQLAAEPDPASSMELAFVRDVNNAYDAILAQERLLSNSRYEGIRKNKLKRDRDIQQLLRELKEKGFQC